MTISRQQAAYQRLARAVDRLEQASKRRPEGGAEGDAELAAELRATRNRCESLESRARDVSDRLDTAIDRVRALMES